MSANNGNIKLSISETDVYKPQSEDFKIFFADDMTEVKAMDSEGNIIPFNSLGGPVQNIYNTDGILTANRIVDLAAFNLNFSISGAGNFVVGPAGHTTIRDIEFKTINTNPVRFQGFNASDGTRIVEFVNNNATIEAGFFECNGDVVLCPETTQTNRSRLTVGTSSPATRTRLTVESANSLSSSNTAVFRNALLEEILRIQSNGEIFTSSLTNDLVAIGTATPNVNSRMTVKGWDALATNYAALFENGSGTQIMRMRNDGLINIGAGTPQGTLHVFNQNGNGTFIDGFSLSASEYILKLRDSAGTELSRFRNSGRVDLATNGASVLIGSGSPTSQFHQISPTAGGSSTPIAQIDSAGGNRFMVRANGRISMPALPTSSAGLSAGDLWNNGGVVNIV